jgi:hypothetical protein
MIRKLSLNLVEKLISNAIDKSRLLDKKISDYRNKLKSINKEADEKIISSYLSAPGLGCYLSEDCAGYKRGRKLEFKDVENIRQKGYESAWISDIMPADLRDTAGKKADLLIIREKLTNQLAGIFNEINEKDAGQKRKGSKIDLLEGDDLLSLKIDSLQREGAAKLSEIVFGENSSKLEMLKENVDKVYNLALKNISLKDNRTLGNFLARKEDKKVKSEASDYLIKHSVDVGIYFTLTLRNLQAYRVKAGAQSNTARYTSGQKFKQEYRVSYSPDLIFNACLGSFIFDIGFNHSSLKRILDKEIQELTNEKGELKEGGFSSVNDKEYLLLKKHVNVGAHLVQNIGFDTSSIITNMMRTHHCYLNGEGYPKRTGSDFNIVVDSKYGKRNISVHRYDTQIHELTNLLSVIDTYDAMINRRPWRLPFSRYEAVNYLFENSCYNENPVTGNPDKEGTYSFAGHERRDKKFDRHLVDIFLSTIMPYEAGEILPLRDIETNKKISDAAVLKHTKNPIRPVVRIKIKDSVKDIDLSESRYSKFYLGEYVQTAAIVKNTADKVS